MILKTILIIIYTIIFSTSILYGKTCTYSTYKWNTKFNKAVEHQSISKDYAELSKQEIHQETGCTVCEEDQVDITLQGFPQFKVCKKIASKVEFTLKALIQDKEPVFKIVAYRVGMTKGPADHLGNRTQFSLHSFGIAIDINDKQNGLYDNCQTFSTACRLIKGGPWSPGQAGSLTPQSKIVKAMKKIGFKWGGEIPGRQKDFMHFSPTGY